MGRGGLVELVEDSLRADLEREVFSNYQQKPLLAKDVVRLILAFHQYYESKQLVKGDKVALYSRNDANWAVVYLATVTYGAVIVPILADFHPSDVEAIIDHSDAKLLFVSDNLTDKLKLERCSKLQDVFSLQSLASKRSNIELSKFAPALEELSPDDVVFNTCHEDHLAVISYTSGTSGNSKGVMLTHKNIWSNARFGWDANLDLGPGDTIVSFLPLAHAYGCLFEFMAPFVMGCHIVFLTKVPSPQIILKAFGEVKPKLVLAVPLVIEKIFKRKILPVISSPKMQFLLRVPVVRQVLYRKINKHLTQSFGGKFIEVIIGGAAFNPEIEAFFQKIGFRLTVGYGMTECGPLISYSGWRKHALCSAGKVVNRMECRIDSAKPGQTAGEIQVKGDNVMMGYYKNSEATQEAFTEDGWLKTGDLGVMDEENNVHIKGRTKSMILGANGQNVYPEEIENVINSHPLITESVVRDNNGRLEALILPDREVMEKQALLLNEAKEQILNAKLSWNQKLPAYSKVSMITFVSLEFEKTPKKSIKRYLYNIQ